MQCASDLLLKEMQTKQLPLELAVTEETVKGRVKNVLSKLGAHDRTHAAMIGLKRGIIEFN